ncbi:MAG: nitrilase-related carbon-nitrogen hydrolase [Armatimonadota bacterium]
MKVGFYQFNPEFGKKQENINKVKKTFEKTEADLIVLPEFFNTGYLFLSKEEVANLSENIPGGPTTEALIRLAREKNCHIAAGLPEVCKDKFYNSAVLVGPGGYIDTYRKIHLFNEEKLYFSPGDKPFKVYDTGMARIGIMICFDWYFPEAARTLALEGAQIICQPANLVLPNCPDAMITRSLENKVFSITANRTGTEKREEKSLTYIGRSQVVSPDGKRLLSAGEREESLKVCDINPALSDNKKMLGHNDAFKDRRPEFYKKLTGDL